MYNNKILSYRNFIWIFYYFFCNETRQLIYEVLTRNIEMVILLVSCYNLIIFVSNINIQRFKIKS